VLFTISESNRLLLGTEEGIYIAELAKDGKFLLESFYLYMYILYKTDSADTLFCDELKVFLFSNVLWKWDPFWTEIILVNFYQLEMFRIVI